VNWSAIERIALPYRESKRSASNETIDASERERFWWFSRRDDRAVDEFVESDFDCSQRCRFR
jgi:hypothetical protein